MNNRFLRPDHELLSCGGVARVLAVGPDQDGAEIRLQFSAFVSPGASLDEAKCAQSPAQCQMSMMRGSEEVWAGSLVRSMGEWVIHRGAGDDDPVWRFDVTCIRPGNQIAVRQPDRVLHLTIVEVFSSPS